MKPDAKKKVEFFFICALGVLVISFFAFSIYLSKKEENGEFNFNSFKSGFISFEDCIADYEVFWDFIYNEYPFTEVCERKGADLKKIKEDGYKKIEYSAPIDSQNTYISFYAKLCEDITSRYFTGHLYPASISDYEYAMTTSDSYFKLYDVDLMNSFYRVKPSYYVNSLIGDGGVVKADTKIIEEGKIAYVRIDSFWAGGYAKEYIQYKKDMKKFFLDTEKYKHIIIDVSNNGGGDVKCYDSDILSYNNIGRNIQQRIYFLCSKNKYTELNPSFKNNQIDIKEVPNIKNANTKKNTIALYEEDAASFQELAPGYAPPKDRKYWLLISGKTASAADRLAGLCKASGFATLVGSNTGGLGHNGRHSPIYIVLPKSGLLIKFDPLYGLNSEGYCTDEFGTAPDIYNLPGKDALETCLEEIRKLESRD
ncbi:S41 family peptidase [Treponema denticola]|uniref:S41 family peptidase n=1 Tax=Treponema denticola TaxID=158 RepID=UPI0020A38046|nr:S41 family peptidase [Treponema denticola]UTC85858.1 peptidase S41 [Treponema denticola]